MWIFLILPDKLVSHVSLFLQWELTCGFPNASFLLFFQLFPLSCAMYLFIAVLVILMCLELPCIHWQTVSMSKFCFFPLSSSPFFHFLLSNEVCSRDLIQGNCSCLLAEKEECFHKNVLSEGIGLNGLKCVIAVFWRLSLVCKMALICSPFPGSVQCLQSSPNRRKNRCLQQVCLLSANRVTCLSASKATSRANHVVVSPAKLLRPYISMTVRKLPCSWPTSIFHLQVLP